MIGLLKDVHGNTSKYYKEFKGFDVKSVASGTYIDNGEILVTLCANKVKGLKYSPISVLVGVEIDENGTPVLNEDGTYVYGR